VADSVTSPRLPTNSGVPDRSAQDPVELLGQRFQVSDDWNKLAGPG
jgi:hypothetical protein